MRKECLDVYFDNSLRRITCHNGFRTHIYNAPKYEKGIVKVYNPEKTVSVTYISSDNAFDNALRFEYQTLSA